MKVLKLNFNIVLAKEEYKNYLLMMLFCLVKLLVVWMHLREDQVRKLLDFHYMETTTVKRGIQYTYILYKDFLDIFRCPLKNFFIHRPWSSVPKIIILDSVFRFFF